MDDLMIGPIFEDGMLPCPFCGGKPTLWPDRTGEVSPYCEDCGAGFFGGGLADEFSKDGEPFHSDERSAVEYWNRRVAPNAGGNATERSEGRVDHNVMQQPGE